MALTWIVYWKAFPSAFRLTFVFISTETSWTIARRLSLPALVVSGIIKPSYTNHKLLTNDVSHLTEVQCRYLRIRIHFKFTKRINFFHVIITYTFFQSPVVKVQDYSCTARGYPRSQGRRPHLAVLHISRQHRNTQGRHRNGDIEQGRHIRGESMHLPDRWQVVLQSSRAHLLRFAQDTQGRFTGCPCALSGVL